MLPSLLPTLRPNSALDACYRQYLTALKALAFAGDIHDAYGHRLNFATDNSIYQLMPQAVLAPRTQADLQMALQLANEPQYQTITFSPRGGGTGTNGQALNRGIIIDLSRYFTEILTIDGEQQQAQVQAGVIKDVLNDQLLPHGLFFAPDLSTSNRATIGGMISTDASGAGSLVYGKTSDHVLSATVVLDDGSVIDTQPWDASARVQLTGRAKVLADTVMALCQQQQTAIAARFPKLNRFLTGYDLKHCYNAETDTLDLTRLICGAEGTLGFVVTATLRVLPIPSARVLVNIQYDSFDSALRDAPALVAANATVVETIDATVLGLAKADVSWFEVADLVSPNIENEARFDGINMVEFAGDNDDVEQRLSHLLQRLQQQPPAVLGYKVCRELASISRVYAMRKKAVGLLGATQGVRKPQPFAEDTVVPPEHLADFIRDFRAILDREQLQYGMFGHVDAGVLHVRPALDMTDPDDQQLLYRLSDEVAELTQRYGGLMWGEHGRGIRSKYGPDVFGELFVALRQIKSWFDPNNKLNPGKICTPLADPSPLLPLASPLRGEFNGEISVLSRRQYERAIRCNGNGLCFNYQKQTPMCPSYKLSGDRVQSPKGRAEMMREWLRLLAEQGIDLAKNPPQSASLWRRWQNSRQATEDFSHEVHRAMQTCLACKACSGACPVKVDIPTLRSEFFQHYYGRYLRPLSDYMVANLESTLPYQAKIPRLINSLSQNAVVKSVLKNYLGYLDAPALSIPSLRTRCPEQPATMAQLEWLLGQLSAQEKSDTLLLVQDPFTSHYEAKVVEQALELLTRLGFRTYLVPYLAHGKPQHIKGFLTKFNATAAATTQWLNRLSQYQLPLIGIDPAMVLSYQDEYVEALGAEAIEFQVQLLAPFLITQLERWPVQTFAERSFRLMSHCTESSVAPLGAQQWQRLFQHFGGELQLIAVGCCGMAGTYGHERVNYPKSKALYEMNWAEHMHPPLDEILISGYSCRSQAKRFERQEYRHPLQALLELLPDETVT